MSHVVVFRVMHVGRFNVAAVTRLRVRNALKRVGIVLYSFQYTGKAIDSVKRGANAAKDSY